MSEDKTFRFADLPIELRYKVYEELMPKGWWHEYSVDPGSGTLTRPFRSGRLPPLFQVARWILRESVGSLIRGTCEIRVCSDSIGVNFPLESLLTPRDLFVGGQIDELAIQLPPCKKVDLTIVLPVRTLGAFMATRRSVAKVVELLNLGYIGADSVPSLEVRLEFSGVKFVWNDVAMLMGPLSRLSRIPVTVSRDTIFSSNARVEQQCHFLESFQGAEDKDKIDKRTLEYQQTMIDVRLPLTQLKQTFPDQQCQEVGVYRHLDPRTESAIVDERSTADIGIGLVRLQEWCSTYKVEPPHLFHRLATVIAGKEVTGSEVHTCFDEVLLPGRVHDYEYWGMGLSTGFNPFRLQCRR